MLLNVLFLSNDIKISEKHMPKCLNNCRVYCYNSIDNSVYLKINANENENECINSNETLLTDLRIDIIIIHAINKTSIAIDNINDFLNKLTFKQLITCFTNVNVNSPHLNVNKYYNLTQIAHLLKSKTSKFILKNDTDNAKLDGSKIATESVISKLVSNKTTKHCSLKSEFIQFSNICINILDKIDNIEGKQFVTESKFEAVYIEFRNLPHSETIIKNCINKLDENWSHTVVCGNDNYDLMYAICNRVNKNIKIIKLDMTNVSYNDYNNLLLTTNFWNMLYGDKILLYQSDSFIFKSNLNEFLEYDYVAPPFNECNKCILAREPVGIGGLSLRTKKVMISVLNCKDSYNVKYSVIANKHKFYNNLDSIPEDVFYSQNIQNLKLGTVADYYTAKSFAMDLVYNDASFGMHCMWNCSKQWQTKFMELFEHHNYRQSILNSNITHLSLYKQPYQSKLSHNSNNFDIDAIFLKKAYNLPIDMSHNQLISYIKDRDYDILFHTKQLHNLFNITIFEDAHQDIVIFYDNVYYKIDNFINYITKLSYYEYKHLCIHKQVICDFVEGDLLLLVFIGNDTQLHNLLNKLITYSTIQAFSVAFCINNKIVDRVIPIIKTYFTTNYVIYSSREFGNDIIPSMLVYDEIIRTHNFAHVLKIHTKSNINIFNTAVDYLLNSDLNTMLLNKNEKSSTIGFFYLNVNKDMYNKKLTAKYKHLCNKTEFVPASIFLTDVSTMNKVVEFIKEHYLTCFFQNMYDDNTINSDSSYIHFIERLFGYM